MGEAWAEVASHISANTFYGVQIFMGAAFIFVLLILRNRDQPSHFRARKKDSALGLSPRPPGGGADLLAEARMKNPKSSPPSLPGIVIDGHPHEVLGVRSDASADEIQKAWKNLMKHYHPDRVGPPDSREWRDAQKIAEALNRAKEEMLERWARRKT